jgi:hypothetical protein
LLAGAGIVWLVAQASAREFQIEAAFLAVTSCYYLLRRKSMRALPVPSSPSSA